MKHIIDDADKNKYEAYTKQEVLNVIQEAISSGELPEEINGLVLTFKNPVDNQAYKIAFCTQAKYNELESGGHLESNCYYYITDDTTLDTLDDMQDDINALENRVGVLEPKVTTNTTNISLLTSKVNRGILYRHDIVWGNRTAGNFYITFTLYTNSATAITTSTISIYISTQTQASGYVGSDGILYNAIGIHKSGTRWYVDAIKNNQVLGFDFTDSSDFGNFTDIRTKVFNLSEVAD